MDISFIIPVYNEQDTVIQLYEEITKVMASVKKTFEIIYINDGSTDKTQSRLCTIAQQNNQVTVLQFQRNFGKAAALMAGFRQSCGNIVFTMDGDLQDDPKEIPKFLTELNKGYDIVSGWKYKRKDPITKTLPSKFFNWLTTKITGVKIHDMNCGYKAYRRKVISQLRIYGELHRYIPALAYWKGFQTSEVKVHHHPRKYGQSKYGIERLLKGFLDLITVKYLMSYTNRPLHFFGPLGILSSIAGFVIGMYILVIRLITGSIQSKYPLLTLCVLLIVLGVQFISIGLIGEMIVNTKREENDYIIKNITSGNSEKT